MLTDDLDPVLIEVNHSPSFRTDSPLDLRVKLSLTANTFALLNVSASERLSCCAEATRQSQMRLYGAVFKEKKGQSLSSSESGSRDSISKKSSTTELETASESTGAGVKKSLTGANSGRSFGRGGTAPVANSKKEKKKKGSTKVPVQTSKQYWRRYLENERRCLGNCYYLRMTTNE